MNRLRMGRLSLVRLCRKLMPFCVVIASLVTQTHAQAIYPTNPVRLAVGFGAGTPPDIAARVIAEKLSELWSVPVIVENVIGASGNVASERVARARPDGHYLLLAANSSIAINPSLFPTMPIDPVKDLVPITIVYTYPNILIVNKEVGVESVQQLVRLARSKPGQLSYGSAGVGTTMHLAGEMLKSLAAIDIEHVPYRGGANLFADLLTARIHFSFAPTTSALEQVRFGAVGVLAVTSSKRFSLLPHLPTMKEAGFPEFDMNVWWGLLAPAATSAQVITKLHRDVTKVLSSPDVQSRFAALGIEPVGNTPEEMSAIIKAEVPKWAKVLKDAKVATK